MNKVILIGRIARDINANTTTSGITYVRSTIAISRRVGQASDEVTDFIPFVVWRNQADFVKKYAGKGSLISIEGYISNSQFKNAQGETVRNIEVVVENLTLLETKKAREMRESTQTINLNYKNDNTQEKMMSMNPEQTNTYTIKITYVDYKDVKFLEKFVTNTGQIKPSASTGNCAKDQRKVANAIKRARFMALLPYVKERVRNNK